MSNARVDGDARHISERINSSQRLFRGKPLQKNRSSKVLDKMRPHPSPARDHPGKFYLKRGQYDDDEMENEYLKSLLPKENWDNYNLATPFKLRMDHIPETYKKNTKTTTPEKSTQN